MDRFMAAGDASDLRFSDGWSEAAVGLKSRAGLFGLFPLSDVPDLSDEAQEEPEILVDVADGIKAKPEVNLADVVNELKDKLSVLFEAYKKFGWADTAANPLVITSGKDSFDDHKKNSLHKKGKALDLRGKHVPNAELSKIAAEIQKQLGSKYRAWAEFWKNPNRDHIHVEYLG